MKREGGTRGQPREASKFRGACVGKAEGTPVRVSFQGFQVQSTTRRPESEEHEGGKFLK